MVRLSPPVASCGFSLLEVLVVMLVMGLAAGFVAPKIKKRDSVTFKAQVRTVVASLHYARRIAVIKGRPQQFTFQQLVADGKEEKQSLDLSWVSYGSDVSMSQPQKIGRDDRQRSGVTAEKSIIFFPDGGNTGGKILLKGQTKQVYIVINPVTGQIETQYIAE